MLTQEVVDFLNQGASRSNWLEANPAILNFVTCPCVIIHPGLFEDAQRISVADNSSGRFVTILKRDGERRYIFQIMNASITIEHIEALICTIESKGGACRVERTFFVIDLPLGFLLDMSDDSLANILIDRQRFEDIGLQ